VICPLINRPCEGGFCFPSNKLRDILGGEEPLCPIVFGLQSLHIVATALMPLALGNADAEEQEAKPGSPGDTPLSREDVLKRTVIDQESG